MAKKSEDEKTKGAEAKTEKSKTDTWRDLERFAKDSEVVAADARRRADEIGSDIAKELIEQHKGAAIDLDGQMYVPKRRATKTLTDGTVKTPVLPYQLVKHAPKTTVEF